MRMPPPLFRLRPRWRWHHPLPPPVKAEDASEWTSGTNPPRFGWRASIASAQIGEIVAYLLWLNQKVEERAEEEANVYWGNVFLSLLILCYNSQGIVIYNVNYGWWERCLILKNKLEKEQKSFSLGFFFFFFFWERVGKFLLLESVIFVCFGDTSLSNPLCKLLRWRNEDGRLLRSFVCFFIFLLTCTVKARGMKIQS